MYPIAMEILVVAAVALVAVVLILRSAKKAEPAPKGAGSDLYGEHPAPAPDQPFVRRQIQCRISGKLFL